MKEIRNYRHYVAIGNGKFEDTSIWNDLRYVEPRPAVEFTLSTFEEACEAIRKGRIHRAEIEYTLFRHRPFIVLKIGDIYHDTITITKKNFKPIRVRYTWEHHNRIVSMDTLMDQLPADEMCEYLKDRGIFQIPQK